MSQGRQHNSKNIFYCLAPVIHPKKVRNYKFVTQDEATEARKSSAKKTLPASIDPEKNKETDVSSEEGISKTLEEDNSLNDHQNELDEQQFPHPNLNKQEARTGSNQTPQNNDKYDYNGYQVNEQEQEQVKTSVQTLFSATSHQESFNIIKHAKSRDQTKSSSYNSQCSPANFEALCNTYHKSLKTDGETKKTREMAQGIIDYALWMARRGNKLYEMDLHWLTWEDAQYAVEQQIEYIQSSVDTKSGGYYYTLEKIAGRNYIKYKFITGKGNHSKNGPVLLLELYKFLKLNKIKCDPEEGYIMACIFIY